jgi:hypothetical protein
MWIEDTACRYGGYLQTYSTSSCVQLIKGDPQLGGWVKVKQLLTVKKQNLTLHRALELDGFSGTI